MQHCECILLIMNCKKYTDKAKKQKETWLNNFDLMPYFHVIGDREKLIDKEYFLDSVNNMLYVNTPDDYNSLPKKVIASYKAIMQEYKFKYIFKTDDDQFLNNINFLSNLKAILLNKFPRIHYGGKILNIDQPHISNYYKIHPELPQNLQILPTKYCAGRFYFLSDIAIIDLITKNNLINKEYFEDYAIGFYLNRTLKANALNIQVDKYFADQT